MLFPADRAETTEIWDVLGLLGTGSDRFSVSGLHVPAEYVYDRDEPAMRREDGPLYGFPLNTPYATGFSATALASPAPCSNEFLALAGEKTPRLGAGRLADNGAIQFEVGECEARLGAARAFLLRELEDVWEDAAARSRVTVEHRMRIRLASTFAIREAKAVGDAVFDAAGATAIFASNGMQRRFRDLHTVAQQLQGRKLHLQTVGAWRLGREPRPRRGLTANAQPPFGNRHAIRTEHPPARPIGRARRHPRHRRARRGHRLRHSHRPRPCHRAARYRLAIPLCRGRRVSRRRRRVRRPPSS